MGMALGAVLTCILAAIFDAEFSAGLEKFYTFLIPVIISLFVASLAVAGVLASIASQDAREEENRKRKLMAARAKLPIALSEIYRVLVCGLRYSAALERITHESDLDQLRDRSIQSLKLPDDSVQTFLEVIEYHDNDEVAERLTGVIKEYQIHLARWLTELDPPTGATVQTRIDARQRTAGWAYLVSLCASVFPYARHQTHLEGISEEFIGALMRLQLPEDYYPEQYRDEISLYVRHFNRRYNRGE
jgi:hypothetical protein